VTTLEYFLVGTAIPLWVGAAVVFAHVAGLRWPRWVSWRLSSRAARERAKCARAAQRLMLARHELQHPIASPALIRALSSEVTWLERYLA